MTKSQINRLGKRLRQNLRENIAHSEEDLYALQEYRTSFKDDIAPVFKLISKLSKDERKDSIVAFRVKRIETILSKIKREPTMALSNMGDIAGCRIILFSDSAFKNLVKTINSEFKVKSFNDYTDIPKEDGYRGYHIYVESPINSDKTIEIQLRTIKTHRWASLVEMIDILFDLKLKEGAKHSDLQEFIKLLSFSENELTIEDKRRIIDIDDKLKVYQSLLEVFIKNHIAIRKSWLSISERIGDNYFIIEVDKNKKSSIISIGDYMSAEQQYFSMFLTNKTSNFVLTYIEKPNFNRVCIAYASYMMMRHDYLEDWSRYAKDILTHDSESGETKVFNLYNDVIKRNLKDQMELRSSETDELLKHLKGKNDAMSHEGIKEWLSELEEGYDKTDKLLKELEKLRPRRKSLIEKLFGN
jgi:ppGpp synthetase/RelA/SpoT-type nucleotidyltranferase